MKYIIFTCEGEGFPIAEHLQKEGKEVIVGQVDEKKTTLTKKEHRRADWEEGFLEKKRRLSLYKNLVPKMDADLLLRKMKRIKNKDDYFIFFDYNHLFRYAEQALEMGFKKGNFPTEKDRLFEIDRDAAKEFVRKHYPEIKTAEKYEFRSIRKAKKFLKEANGGKVWVLKGKSQDSPTFIPETDDPELAKWQVIETLEAFEEYYQDSGFILERKIDSVVEITPEKLYYNGKPVSFCLNFENKPFGSGNLSLQTGCAADLVFPLSMQNKIHDIAFPPIVDKLARRHKGLFFWDASLLIDRQNGDIYFGEFCPNRPWYNSFFTYLSMMPSVHYFFETIVQQKNPFTLGTVGASLTLFNLLRDPTDRYILSGSSINYTQRAGKNVWPYDIYKKTKNDKMRIVGYDWQLSPITGTGNSIQEAVRKLYKNVESFSFAGIYYRPKSDYLSKEYETSIINRFQYGIKKKLYDIPFDLL